MGSGGDVMGSRARTVQRRQHFAAGLLLVLVGGTVLASANTAGAAEVPGTGDFYIQTDGPNALVGRGDWYTATSFGAGAGHHYIEFTVACGWPSSEPIVIDLFSPEMVQSVAVASGGTEEFTGALDNTVFELYAVGVTAGPGPAQPAAGDGTVSVAYPPKLVGGEEWVRFTSISSPACGTYTVRAATADDDQNGWRIRVGADTDAVLATPPVDDLDGVPGTDDEIIVGLAQTSYQQGSGTPQCFSLFEFVEPGQSSIAIHNFDYDGYDFPSGAEVTYTSPSGVAVVGTVSNPDASWNGSNTISRGGDIIANPEGGWWELRSCMASNNQFIQEGMHNVPAYVSQPPAPQLQVTKTDGQSLVTPGQQLTYTITVNNLASGAGAGAATSVVVTDALPPGLVFQSCGFVLPRTGTCIASAGVVTATLDGSLNAGATAGLTVTASVASGASGTLTNTALVDYYDSFGHEFPTLAISDANSLPAPAVLPPSGVDGARTLGWALGATAIGALLAGLGLRRRRRA